MGQEPANVELELLQHQRTERKKEQLWKQRNYAWKLHLYIHSQWINNSEMYSEGQKWVNCNLQRLCKKGKVAVQIKLIQKSKDTWLKLKKIEQGWQKIIISEEMTEESKRLKFRHKNSIQMFVFRPFPHSLVLEPAKLYCEVPQPLTAENNNNKKLPSDSSYVTHPKQTQFNAKMSFIFYHLFLIYYSTLTHCFSYTPTLSL